MAASLAALALAELEFIDRREVVHFLGPPGTGKSRFSRSSIRERIFDFALLARRVVGELSALIGIDDPGISSSRLELNAALSYTDRTEGGRPPFDPVLIVADTGRDR
jgi:hypothetical protein